MVAGVNGQSGLSAPRAVVEEGGQERDCATIQSVPMVEIRVQVMDTLRQIPVTMMPVQSR